MAKEIRLPQLGQTMQEATIISYLVKVGDKVNKTDVIFEVETDKAVLEVESPAAGFVKQILVELGRTIPVNTPIMVLGKKDEKPADNFIESLKAEINILTAGIPESSPIEPEKLETLLVTENLKTASPEIRLGQSIPLSRLEKMVGRRMLQSKREIPCFYLSVRADVSKLAALRDKLNQTGDIRIAYHDFIMRATALTLKEYPTMTGKLAGDYIQLPESINIGLAIDIEGKLVAPVIKDADKKTLAQIATESARLIDKARSNKLTVPDLEGGCITLSNLGQFGIDSFIPIVVPGQCSILGIGRITDNCVPEDGGATVRKIMNLTLAVDHRITNGAYATQFLDHLRRLLQEAEGLV
jgi:pyruvate dehydrogenase E2 component (dihydrolipoamide acetyltransferase)